MNPTKQVILIRKDLRMRRGKEIAQGSHASLEFLASKLRAGLIADLEVSVRLSPQEADWLSVGMAKICLQVNSEEELVRHHAAALERGLTSHLIRDSGRTEFGGKPTLTACAIGPDESDKIDAVTRDLSLY